MIVQDYRVTDVRADMTYGHFRDVLAAANSPALPEAHGMYSHLVANRGVSVAAFLAFFKHESGYGHLGICKEFDTKNPGNVRSPEVPGAGVVIDTPRGKFAKYPDWRAGTADWAARINGPKYAGAGLTTVRQILPKYAPSSENDTERYIATVLAEITRHTSQTPSGTKGGTMPPKPAMNRVPSPNRGYNGATYVPEAIVWHISQGSEASGIGWLTNPASRASSNYMVGRTGTITELVDPEAGPEGTAWANGQLAAPDLSNPLIASWVRAGINPNRRVVSIEHAGWTSKGAGGSLTAAQIKASVALTAWLCGRFGIAPDRTHILGHFQVDDVNRHDCPGFSAAEWRGWVGRVAALVGGGTPGPSVGDPGFPGGIQANGATVLNGVNFEGEAVTVEEVTVQVLNAAGRRFRRRWVGHQLEPWEQV